MRNSHRNPERPKLKGAYHPDSEGHAERTKEGRVERGGTTYISSGAMPPMYGGPDKKA